MFYRKTAFIVLFTFGLLSFLPPGNAIAIDHIVTSTDLHSALHQNIIQRERDLGKIEQVLKSGPGGVALKRAGMQWEKIEKVLPQLSNQEAAALAAQADQVHSRFTAGMHWDPVTVLLIVFLVVAIILIVQKID